MNQKKKKTPGKHRLTSQARRESILSAAVPIFAEVGFRGTTTKTLARELNISEALLYQHFPSKEDLFAQVQDFMCSHLPKSQLALVGRKASTETLVFLVYSMANFLIDAPASMELNNLVPRVMVQSFLADGEFARSHIEKNMRTVIDLAADCITEGRKNGDISPSEGTPNQLLFWFVHHVMVMINLGRLPAVPVYEYHQDKKQLIENAVRFSLRGIGLTEAAMKRCFNADALQKSVNEIFLHLKKS